MIVLTAAVSATTAVREALLTQYYDQLAQVAGEAGVAYAKACLAANGNKPTWSNAKPLTPQTDCTGTVVSGYPANVSSNADVVSSFSVGMPTVDANGFAVTIPNNGYVQLLRSSTGIVWKTYSQPSVQPAVVPDLCSGAATSGLGWNNAVLVTYGTPTNPAGAQPISILNSAVNPGPVYYRKDFNVSVAGTYTIKLRVDDWGSLYIDGASVGSTYGAGTITSFSVTLSAGCHTMNVNSYNANATANGTNIALSMTPVNSTTPLVVSDTSWRVTAGNTIPFNAPGFWTDPGSWPTVRDMQPSYTVNSGWAAASGDANSMTRWISPSFGYDGSGNYPASSYIAMRDTRTITVSSPTDVKVAYDCDDSCTILLDGNPIGNGVWNSVQVTNLTLTQGSHSFGIILYNGSGGTGAMLSVLRTSDNTMLTRTEANSWQTNNAFSASAPSFSSYDANYSPTPSATKGLAYAQLLVVGGGGGAGNNAGGGGGGGGVVYNSNYQLSVGTTAITVGGGGAGSPGGTSSGSNGANSAFGSIIAYGGGAGASRDGGNSAQSGGSGGGGAGATQVPRNIGASGIAGQGSNGGNGVTPDAGCNTDGGGGGGFGGAGWSGVSAGLSGQGGPGTIGWITGSPFIYGAGGAGSITCSNSIPGLSDSPYGGNGYGGAGLANSGGGGGANGGAGGSGVVIISFPTGSITVGTVTGSPTITTAFGNTIYKFTANGSFQITSINV